jgi:hypothetical protein
MTGPEHYAEAERLLTLADRHTKGVTYAQEWTLTLNAAQVHATLALAAATAVGTVGPDLHAWPPPAMRCANSASGSTAKRCCTSVLYRAKNGRFPRKEPAAELGGRYWDRTSDLLGVNGVRSSSWPRLSGGRPGQRLLFSTVGRDSGRFALVTTSQIPPS